MMKSNAQKPLSSILNKGPKPGVNREHPAVKLAEKIEQRLWNWNYLGPTKTGYRIDELWLHLWSRSRQPFWRSRPGATV